MNGNIEQQILGDYANQGYALEEDGDDTIIVWYKGCMLAAFSQVGVTPQVLQDVCRRHMERLTEEVKL